ncbi:TIC20-V, partial [Symbiodinium sp. CCMP2456]
VTDLEDLLSGVTDLREDSTMRISPKAEKMNSNDMTMSMTSEYAGKLSPSYANSHLKAQATVEQLLSEYAPGRTELMLIRLKSGLDYFAGFLVLMNSMVLLLQFEMEG